MAYLVLSDGTTFEGKTVGADADITGEIVFTTGMTGYQEELTDPSFCGQIVVMTYPLIGNYGFNSIDNESDRPWAKGVIMREYCAHPSNFRMEIDLSTYFKRHNIVGLYGVDTRALTRKLRNMGTMNGCITQKLPDKKRLALMQGYRVAYPVGQVTCQEPYEIEGKGLRIAVLDYGLKRSILHCLSARGCRIKVFPSTASAEEVLSYRPDGILLSNGPGNPEDNINEVAELKQLLGKKPIFGICLGHQIAALAYGGSTEKLKYGHRGANQPVKDLNTGRVYVTSQNHGYAVRPESLKGVGVMSYVNGNDGTAEGMRYFDGMTQTVQFHPEACPGPKDTAHLFDTFLTACKKGKY